MAIEQAKLASRIGYGGFRYVLDLRGPHGERDIKEFKSPAPQEFMSQALDKFVLAFGAKQYPIKQASPYPAGGFPFLVNYPQPDILYGSGVARLHELLSHPQAAIPLEIQPSRKQQDAYVMVKVVALKEGKALCKALYKNHWLEIELGGESLERQDIREGDVFEWIPNEDGVLRGPDIRNHPRREEPGETERTQRAFDELAKMVQKAGG